MARSKPSSRSRSSAKRPSGKRAPAKTASRSGKREPTQRFRSGLVVRGGLIAATIAVGAGLAAFPVGDWRDQQEELDTSRTRQAELEAEIGQIREEIDAVSGPDGIEERGMCFGPYVVPGVETYSVPGVNGCTGRDQP